MATHLPKSALVGYTERDARVYADDRNFFLWDWPHSGRTGGAVLLERMTKDGIVRFQAFTFAQAARYVDRVALLPPLPREGVAVRLPPKLHTGLLDALGEFNYRVVRAKGDSK